MSFNFSWTNRRDNIDSNLAGDVNALAVGINSAGQHADELFDLSVQKTDIVNDDTTGGIAVPASAEIVKTHGTNKADISKMFYPNNVYGGIISANFDTITLTGTYTGYGTATGAPNTLQSWFMRHINSNTGTVSAYQEAIGYTDGAFYNRYKRASVWTSWTLQPSGAALSTSVSQLSTQMIEKTSYGVYSGLSVTAQSTPNMTVSVAVGIIYMVDGTRLTPAAVSALAITTADATNPRIDIVYVNSSGVIAYLAGTAAASPSAPSVPTDGQKIAEISVAAGAAAITTAMIADRRKTLTGEAFISATLSNGWTGTLKYMKLSSGFVTIYAEITAGTIAGFTSIATIPSGYRPIVSIPIVALDAGAIAKKAFILSSGGGFLTLNSNELAAGATYKFEVAYYVG